MKRALGTGFWLGAAVLLTVGCGPKPMTAERLVGTWQAEPVIDEKMMTDALRDRRLSGADARGAENALKDLMKASFEFREGGVFSMTQMGLQTAGVWRIEKGEVVMEVQSVAGRTDTPRRTVVFRPDGEGLLGEFSQGVSFRLTR